MKKILITGASGFIGGFLVEEALRRGYEVWAGIRCRSSRAHLTDPRLRFIDLAYRDTGALIRQIADTCAAEGSVWDYVIHNAGLTKARRKSEFHQVNAVHTAHLAEALVKSGCVPQKFLLMSSLSAYGPGDASGRPIRPGDEPHPDTAYGRSKIEAERSLMKLPFPTVVLRPTGVYGPGEKDYFIEIQSISKGFDFSAGLEPQKLSFIYVKDLARAAFLALEAGSRSDGKHYLVSDGDTWTDAQFAGLIRKILGKKHLFRLRAPLALVWLVCLFGEAVGFLSGRSLTLNLDKYRILRGRNWTCEDPSLVDDLGFHPEYDLRRGLEEAIAWYRAKGWLK
jgi:nucleoside-diphosphate-sugar epimerase